jgi:hypothetical protein
MAGNLQRLSAVQQTGQALDVKDRQIIVATQEGLPLVAEPFAELARQLGLQTNEVLQRVAAMEALSAVLPRSRIITPWGIRLTVCRCGMLLMITSVSLAGR